MRLIRNSLHQSQILRFVVVGGINTAFSYGIYALVLLSGFNFAVANLVALSLGILFSFKTQGTLVFRNGDNRRFWRFILSWTIIYLATITLISQFIASGLNAYISGALALPFSTVLSYMMQKYFVFHTPTPRPPALAKPNSEESP